MFNEATGSPLAIDHGRNFQYIAPRDRDVTNTMDGFERYVTGTSLEGLEPLRSYSNSVNERHAHSVKTAESYQDTVDWWDHAGPKIKATLEKRLEQIKDPEVREHISRNFNARAGWLDELSRDGVTSHGLDWYRAKVPLYKPGELTEEEQEDPQIIAKQHERNQAKRMAVAAARKEGRDAKVADKQWMAAMPLQPAHLHEIPWDQRKDHPGFKAHIEAYNKWYASRPKGQVPK